MNGKKSFRRDSRGSTFLVVLVSLLFIAALGVTVMTIAVTNFQTMTVDQASKMNFYDAEAVLTEVKTGVGELAGEAYVAAYSEAMEKFREYEMAAHDIKKLFDFRFLASMLFEFDGTNDLRTLDEKDAATAITYSGSYDVDVVKNCARNGDYIVTDVVKGENTYTLDLASTPATLTLNNIKVRVTTDTDYETTLNTDLVLTAPNIDMDTVPPNVFSGYALIGNTGIHARSGNAGRVVGNVYSGTNGFNVESGSEVDVRSDYFLSRGAINVFNNAKLELSGPSSASTTGNRANVWVEDIMTSRLSSDAEAEAGIAINANCYVADDLEINAKNSRVTIAGDYRGYNYNETNAANEVSATADYSSAVLVNGLHSKLDLSGVEYLQLAGRAFISREGVAARADNDILTSESVAVKSNQLAYLVPREYMRNDAPNPVLSSELADVDDAVNLDASAAIWGYLDHDKPYTTYTYQTAGDDVYYYFFLNFADGESANQYMTDYYYEDHKLVMGGRAGAYVTDDSEIVGTGSLVETVGVVFDYPGGLRTGGVTYQSEENVTEAKLNSSVAMATDYLSLVRYLSKNGSDNLSRWTDGDKEMDAVYNMIVNEAKVGELDAGIAVPIDGEDYKLYLYPGDFSIPTEEKKGLVVCNGDVTVNGEFEGSIIAGGTISWSTTSVSMTANASMVDEIIDWAAENAYHEYFAGLEAQSVTDAGDLEKALSSSMTYSSWRKNEEESE